MDDARADTPGGPAAGGAGGGAGARHAGRVVLPPAADEALASARAGAQDLLQVRASTLSLDQARQLVRETAALAAQVHAGYLHAIRVLTTLSVDDPDSSRSQAGGGGAVKRAQREVTALLTNAVHA